MALYVRQLQYNDLDKALAVETAAFPPAEAATYEKIAYRLTVCPELCIGLFLRTGADIPAKAPADIPVITKAEASDNDILIGHVISTKTENKLVRDEDMECPINWQADPQAEYPVGHKRNGKTVALHALAIEPRYQRSGFGKSLMMVYIKLMQRHDRAERISILTYDRLVPYYKKIGFEHYGKSESEYAGVEWHDLVSECPAGIETC